VARCLRCLQLEDEVQRLRGELTKARQETEATAALTAPTSIESAIIREVFDTWRVACGHERAKLTQDRRSKVRARLREGYTSSDLMEAVHGAAIGAYVDGRGHKWDDLTLICRSGTNVERFIAIRQANTVGDELRGKFIA
jgi:hypothetical protein